MMYTTGLGSGSGFAVLWIVHMLAVLAFGIGIVFLLVWAVRTLTLGNLKTWGIGLVVAGTILCLLTIGVRGAPWGVAGMEGGTRMMRIQMMDRMHEGMMGDDDRGMTMDDMIDDLQGKTGDDFDAAFIEGMIVHHEGAIDMAKQAQVSAKHAEIKAMAEGIITAQQKEIDQMTQWEKDWGYTR
jgi:hypothetical protein